MIRIPVVCFLVLIFLSVAPIITEAQQPPLTLENYLRGVVDFHPVSRQALNYFVLANAELLESKGAFDPELYGYAKAKRFSGSNYYRTLEGGVSYQTPFALRAKVGFEEASGTFLNPMNKVPSAGQFKTELTLPVGKGLLMDEERARRRIAGIGVQRAESERLSLLNELLANAGYSYWEWVYTVEQRRIYEMVTELAEIRQEAVKYSFEFGAKPALDTLEANIQLRNRRNQLQQSLLEERQAIIELTNYLWTEEGQPDSSTFIAPAWDELSPPEMDIIADPSRINTMVTSHPDIRQMTYGLDQVRVEERLKKEYLKPKADISFALLGEGWRFAGTPGADNEIPVVLEDNHIWKISLGFPLFLRSARGALQANRVKQDQISLKIDQKQLELTNKAEQFNTQLMQLQRLYEEQQRIAAEYKLLWEAENEKFNLGKGSLFLINARESQWIQAELKAVKFFAELQKSYLKRQLALGILANDYLE